MKKNLQNALVLAMGLMTTVTFAQDWNVDSRTRVNASGDEGYQMTSQRATLGATWGGSDWGVHVSTDLNYTLGVTGEFNMDIYEAYASTDLMGYATVTAGRQALNYGSGALISSNDWNANRTTWDGLKFDLGLTDMATITVGYASANIGYTGGVDAADGYGGDSTGFAVNAQTGAIEMTYSEVVDAVDAVDATETENIGNMWINASGEFSGWNVNMLYMTNTAYDNAATGIDISGEVMGAGISASMNTDFNENTMRVLGVSYAVNDDMSVNVGQTVYGEEGAFSMAGTDLAGGWANGNMGYLGAGDEMLSYGLTYNMGGISMGATMNAVTSLEDEITGDVATRDVMEVSLGYSLSDNAALAVKYATDASGDADAVKYTWLTLTVRP